eukprot:TRINITY_DN12275_c0_g1_i3.p1 TRINITY_DN12275_c0_g1~~TRINITY_DN12275_c0_g1_i3.p1  ORF type:complete len:253 (+),score=47.67 TRINITY_DN12275_c0_g1_i3:91-849(+)
MPLQQVKKGEPQIEMNEYAWWKCWHWCSGPKEIKIRGVKPDMVYMKMFKDMECGDIDQLVPGTRVRFSLLDKLMIWIPVTWGFCFAIYKIVRGELDFQGLRHILTTLFLILFPLYYGYRAYSATQLKKQQLKARLNELFLLHNLTNNSGVLSYLVEEAEEQEDKETLMAYFFLWKNGQTSMSKEALDKIVEDFLTQAMKKYNIDMSFDFDVTDAVDDCVKMGLAYESEPGQYMAVNLPTALQRVAVKNFEQK